jgi:hypothetical protein
MENKSSTDCLSLALCQMKQKKNNKNATEIIEWNCSPALRCQRPGYASATCTAAAA